jgi:hypothetical protein
MKKTCPPVVQEPEAFMINAGIHKRMYTIWDCITI